MATVDLEKISIDDLKPGMYVHAIAEQSGQVKIKTKGKVTHAQLITAMRRKGILAVVIDHSKQFQPDDHPDSDKERASSQHEPTTKRQPTAKGPTVSFEEEVNRAKQIHSKGKAIQKRLLDNVAKGLPVDIEVPREFSRQLVGSIDRNPNALLCMTKIREKDSYLLEHSLNVAILLANFAKKMGFPENDVHELAYAGFLHDIGKIKIPDEILHKPGRLTDAEMTIMRDHVELGIDSLTQMDIPQHIIRTVSEHHERLDGLGYPFALKGDQISKLGRMIAIVDTYDAITADRVYKPGMPSQKALKILLKDSPAKYDQKLVQQFIKCVGIYPVGSLVKLSNERIAMVVEQNEERPLKPIVKVFYSTRNNHYLPPKNVDLSKEVEFDIENGVLAKDYKLDFNRYFNESIAT